MCVLASTPSERFFHRASHADFIDVAHVVNVETAIAHQFFLALVDRTNADLTNARRIDRRRMTAEFDELRRTEAAQARHGHAVKISGWRNLRGA